MRLQLLILLAAMTAACGVPSKNNANNGDTNNGDTSNGDTNNSPNVVCALEPMCQPGEKMVDSCDGLDECRTEETCAGTIHCVPGDIEASDFDQSCSIDDDCILIHEGDPCECHVCPDAAISRSAQTDHQDAIAAAMCTEASCPAIACADEFLPHCTDGTCDLRKAKYASTDEFDTSCDEPEDCVAVFEGEVCTICACPNAAINANDSEAYEAQFDVECKNGDVRCEACAQPTFDCVANTCQITNM